MNYIEKDGNLMNDPYSYEKQLYHDVDNIDSDLIIMLSQVEYGKDMYAEIKICS